MLSTPYLLMSSSAQARLTHNLFVVFAFWTEVVTDADVLVAEEEFCNKVKRHKSHSVLFVL